VGADAILTILARLRRRESVRAIAPDELERSLILDPGTSVN
jgi:hypothetical protein